MRLPDGTGLDLLAGSSSRAGASGHRHHRLRVGRERRRGPQGRRLRLPHQAGRPAAVPRRGGQALGRLAPDGAAGAAAPAASCRHRATRSLPAGAAAAPTAVPPCCAWPVAPRPCSRCAPGAEGGAQHGAGAGARRVGHRQGAGGARHPRRRRARRRPFVAVNCGAIPSTCSRPSSSATARAPSPAPPRTAKASSRPRRAAPCSSTRSATCRWPCRASCCA
jgi:hypothetical protein